MKLTAIAVASALLASCSDEDNLKPTYGDLGLPSNCRAYVQSSIDGYRAKVYSADDAMNGLQRNCGLNGNLWKGH